MAIDAVIWTEGKTDSQYLARAREALHFPYGLNFAVSDDMGDDALLKQCIALARVSQPHPTIFIFDRDSPEILSKVNDPQASYKSWGNSVFSFAIPVPDHRPEMSYTCIELYFSDDDLQIKDSKGRRLFLSSEFNANSGRNLADPSLSVAHKGRLVSGKGGSARIVDTEVYDGAHKNVALSKADFAHNVIRSIDAFASVNFGQFNKILAIIEEIIGTFSIDPVFRGFSDFVDEISELEKPAKLASATEAAIRMCRLYASILVGTTLRYYDPATSKFEVNLKRLRPIHQTVIENFTLPSLSTLTKAAEQCCHLIDDHAPDLLRELRAMLLSSPTLSSIGDLLDDIERVIPPDTRRGRTILKRGTKKQLLEYVFSELAKYESRLPEIRDADLDTLDGADDSVWIQALIMLADWMAPVRTFEYRVGNILRLEADADKFVVNLTTYCNGRERTEEVVREYADLSSDRLEMYEIRVPAENEPWVEIFPFVTVKDRRLHSYNRTRAVGYEYRPAFGSSVHIVPTKRKFSHAALEGAVAADRQVLFWTRVAPAVSGAAVRANIPAHDPNAFVGRKQQLATIFEEVVEIPNENGLLYGPGGIGKTALLIEISRKIFDEGLPASAPFKNVIWVSAKKDYYDPTLDVVEAGTQQFKSLDQILISILEFHEFQEPEQYTRDDQRWLVLELFEEEKTLLILDNFETISKTAQDEIIRFFGTEVKRHLRKTPDNFKVLITSREVIPSGFHQIQLKGLDKRDSNLFTERLYQPYAQSGHAQLTDAQRNLLYEATKGIPLIIKHCYGQVYEYTPLDVVLSNLVMAGNKVIEFSFAEIFRFLKDDEIQVKILILLEIVNRPILIRQIADILSMDQSNIEGRISNLLNFQCLVRLSSDVDDKYTINPEVKLLAAKLVHDFIQTADEIRGNIARLAAEKRIDYNKEEFEAFQIFRQYLSNGFLAQAEDFIQERLREKPESILFNIHYAKYLKEQKHRPREAIDRLENIRKSSGNAPEVLRLLVMFNAALEPPDFDQAHIYAEELEKHPIEDWELMMDIAEFYTAWSTSLKLKFELDPIKEMLRHQKYKELADHAINLLQSKPNRSSHRWHYLLSQCFFNKWDYDAAKKSIERAISNLPAGSYLDNSYERLKYEIGRNARRYQKR